MTRGIAEYLITVLLYRLTLSENERVKPRYQLISKRLLKV